MKNKKILAVGLCGAICLSLAGFTYANALASDAPKNLASETENTSGVDILYHDTDGGQISVDGKNWVAEADYEKNNAAPDVQWWTAEEYEAWMNEQKNEMEALIGTGDGWYDGQGVFHEFTQESVDAMMDSYKETLESIKKGVLYSKDDGDGDTYSMIPPTEDVVSLPHSESFFMHSDVTSAPAAANRSLSRFDDMRISIEGETVLKNSRVRS